MNALDFDLGESKLMGSLSLPERSQRELWNHWYQLELNKRNDEHGEWESTLKHTGAPGGPPMLDFTPVRARNVRLELGTFRPHPIQVSELRLFSPRESSP